MAFDDLARLLDDRAKMSTESRCLTNADGGGGDDGGDGHVGDGDDDDEGRLPAKKADMLVSKRSGQSTCDGANAVANKHEGTLISKRSGQATCTGANAIANKHRERQR